MEGRAHFTAAKGRNRFGKLVVNTPLEINHHRGRNCEGGGRHKANTEPVTWLIIKGQVQKTLRTYTVYVRAAQLISTYITSCNISPASTATEREFCKCNSTDFPRCISKLWFIFNTWHEIEIPTLVECQDVLITFCYSMYFQYQIYCNSFTRCTSMICEFFSKKKRVEFGRMIKTSLFKVRSIVCCTFFLSFGQLVNTRIVKIFAFCCEPFIGPFFHIFVRTKTLFSKYVTFRRKQVVIGRNQV